MRSWICFALLLAAAPAFAQPARDLPARLARGGYVLVMRHASSPMALPDKSTATPGNTGLERQLDRKGRDSAAAMGRALKALHIPVGEIDSSPTYRARQTIRLMGLPAPKTVAALGDAGKPMAMAGPGSAAQGAWLKAKAAQMPAPGSNTLVVTHGPNIAAAFPDAAKAMADGEMLVFKPDGKGESALAGRVKMDDWPALAGMKRAP